MLPFVEACNPNLESEDFPRNFISTANLDNDQLQEILELAARGKRNMWRDYDKQLAGKVLAMLFFNPSLRTRCSLQSGIARLGGSSVVMNNSTDAWNFEFRESAIMNGDKAEHIKDAAKVLSAYFDAVCVRSFPEQKDWEEDKKDTVIHAFAKYLKVPLISMESGIWHPCQALADALTLNEIFKGKCQGKRFVLTWAQHPKSLPMAVPNSAALIAAQMGCQVCITCPRGYELSDETMGLVNLAAAQSGGSVEIINDQATAIKNADIIYAKSWTPPIFIGKEEKEKEFRSSLRGWCVDSELMATAPNARFMHCLPVRRNVVVTDEVLDSSACVIEQQAANRLHAQNALLIKMLGN